MPNLPNVPLRPTPWQQRTMWTALTCVSLFVIGWVAIYVMARVGAVLTYLQPLLVPVAVAAIMAYLLDPVVEWLTKRGLARTRAVLLVFLFALLALSGILFWVLPQLYHQSIQLATDTPKFVETAGVKGMALAQRYQTQYADNRYVQQAIQQVQTWAQQQLPGLPDRVLS